MKSFQELYCEENRCDENEFGRRIFWECLHRPALPLVPLLDGPRAEFFSADRELIAGVGRATNFAHVRIEITDFVQDSRNRSWLRSRAQVRLSTARLKNLTRRYLTGADSRSPIGEVVTS